MASKEIHDKTMSKKNKILFSLITIFLSLFIVFVISEVLLRLIPIPGIDFEVHKYDTLTGAGFYPNSTNFYRNDRGDYVKRKINKYGYYDKNYDQKKKDGFIRIGFFGDSYTEAVQVPLEETFHYLIEENLSEYKIETLSFGASGYGTFQSYLTYKKWDDFFDLDAIVYVFFENDLGDQIEVVKKNADIPYPLIINNQLVVDNSFLERNKNRSTLYYKFFDYLTSHSLVMATVIKRLKLLLRYGIKVRVTEEDRFMQTSQDELGTIKYPPLLNQGDNPSVWPDSLRESAIKLEEKILLNWRDQVHKNQKDFIILYTPKDIKNPTYMQDTWKPWLVEFCEKNGIPLIDPTQELADMESNGKEVFYDHYTKYGHIATAREFIKWWVSHQ